MAVQVRDLHKHFSHRVTRGGFQGFFRPERRKVEALRGIDLSIDRGELVAFIGPNGAGKSTTIKLITGILYPDRGDISVLGLDPHRQRRELSYKIASVFGQKSQLWFHLPPLDSLRLLGAMYGLTNSQTEQRIEYLSNALELSEFLAQPVRKLSLGQRIRCEIAGSLIHNPEIVFLDEPSIGLDLVAKQNLRQLIRKINREEDVTIFLTSHDVGDIEKVCKRVVIINDGSIVWDGPTDDLKYRFLKTRIISFKLEQSPNIEMEGLRILKQKPGALKVEVNTRICPVQKVFEFVMANSDVYDVAVHAPPMEDVIARIYGGDV